MSTHDIRDKLDGLNGDSHMLIGFPDAGSMLHNRDDDTTELVLRMAHRISKETKQQPGTAGPGTMLG